MKKSPVVRSTKSKKPAAVSPAASVNAQELVSVTLTRQELERVISQTAVGIAADLPSLPVRYTTRELIAAWRAQRGGHVEEGMKQGTSDPTRRRQRLEEEIERHDAEVAMLEKLLALAADKPGIVVYPSAEQIERFQLVANLLQTTVERLLITCTLADLNTANDWYEWQDFTQHHLARYEDGSATMGAKEKRIEHEVPDRLLALAGYKLPVKPKKGGK